MLFGIWTDFDINCYFYACILPLLFVRKIIIIDITNSAVGTAVLTAITSLDDIVRTPVF